MSADSFSRTYVVRDNNDSYPSPSELTTNATYNAAAEDEYYTFKTGRLSLHMYLAASLTTCKAHGPLDLQTLWRSIRCRSLVTTLPVSSVEQTTRIQLHILPRISIPPSSPVTRSKKSLWSAAWPSQMWHHTRSSTTTLVVSQLRSCIPSHEDNATSAPWILSSHRPLILDG